VPGLAIEEYNSELLHHAVEVEHLARISPEHGRRPSPELVGHLERLRGATRSPAEVATLCLRAAGHPSRVVQGFPLRAGIYKEAALLPEVFEARVSCAEASVTLLGLPYVFWSFAVFVAIEAVALWLLLRKPASAGWR